MKQVNFSHPGGFPLEQETLERLQTAYRTELFGALKSHLGINPDNDYIVAPATSKKVGWAIIRQDGEGILYPIQIGTPTNFLKTTRTGTNLTYGTGELQTAYFDYDAQYISETDYANRPASPITDASAIHYYDLKNPAFIVIKDIKTIEANINTIEADIKNYLPLDGSKAMKGDLDLGIYQLSKLDIKESPTANVRVTDFRLGSALGRALVDGRNQSSKSLSLNYQSDWENTNIGGKVFLNNINTSDATGSLLVVDNANQVTKSNTLIDSLLNRITALENKSTTDVPIGTIQQFVGAVVPEGWINCEGQKLLKSDYPKLFEVLQTTDPDNASQFLIPNLRSRFLIGYDKSSAKEPKDIPVNDIRVNFGRVGNTGGSNSVALTGDQNGSHYHGYSGFSYDANNWRSGGDSDGGYVVYKEDKQTSNSGFGMPHANLPMYYVVRYIIFLG